MLRQRRFHPSSFILPPSSFRSLLLKSAPILARSQERLHHLCPAKVAAKTFELSEPEVVAIKVSIRGRLRIATEIAKILHQHKGAVELLLHQRRILCHVA